MSPRSAPSSALKAVAVALVKWQVSQPAILNPEIAKKVPNPEIVVPRNAPAYLTQRRGRRGRRERQEPGCCRPLRSVVLGVLGVLGVGCVCRVVPPEVRRPPCSPCLRGEIRRLPSPDLHVVVGNARIPSLGRDSLQHNATTSRGAPREIHVPRLRERFERRPSNRRRPLVREVRRGDEAASSPHAAERLESPGPTPPDLPLN